METEAVTLALDGVIFDTEDAQLHACNGAFEVFGLDLRWSLPQLRTAVRVWGTANVLASVAEKISLPVSDERIVHLVQEKNRLFHEFVLSSAPLRNSGCAQLMVDALHAFKAGRTSMPVLMKPMPKHKAA